MIFFFFFILVWFGERLSLHSAQHMALAWNPVFLRGVRSSLCWNCTGSEAGVDPGVGLLLPPEGPCLYIVVLNRQIFLSTCGSRLYCSAGAKQ